MARVPPDLRPLGLLIYSDECEDVRERLIALINKKRAHRTIALYAYKSQTSTKLEEIPSDCDWLNWVGSDAEPFGYYCDVNASPSPRRAVNERLPRGLVRWLREWANMRDGARYNPLSGTSELYDKSLHCVWHRVHISKAVFDQLVLEACGAGSEIPHETQRPQPFPRGKALDNALDGWVETTFEPDGPAQGDEEGGSKQYYKVPDREGFYRLIKAKPEFWNGTYADAKRLRAKYASPESIRGGARFHRSKRKP